MIFWPMIKALTVPKWRQLLHNYFADRIPFGPIVSDKQQLALLQRRVSFVAAAWVISGMIASRRRNSKSKNMVHLKMMTMTECAARN